MIQLQIERLLQFALNHKMIEKLDVICARNSLMDLLNVTQPYEGQTEEEKLVTATGILENIADYAIREKIIEDSLTYRELFSAKLMGLLMPRESEVVKRFEETAKQFSVEAATDEFYALSRSSNYIQVDAIAKNLYWRTNTEFGDMEITVNLSKPEKDPKDIAAAKSIPQTNYPKCLLCLENVGFVGNLNHPARQNHRVIPISLNHMNYYLQYSPYVYYNEHCIVFNEQHIPMKINRDTFVALSDFVEKLPHYFVGSNADLPIVGGSILTHDHFQGGHHVFPMELAEVEKTYVNSQYKNIKIGRVKWPMSVIRLASGNKQELIDFSDYILNKWRDYSDEQANIYAYTNSTPHNTITPIVRKNADGDFEFDLVLRNNRTSAEHPMGIFHPHNELHHIKKENIGLIEVMGLAVLPGRLNNELSEIADILTGTTSFDKCELGKPEHILNKHVAWIEQMLLKYSIISDKKKAEYILQQEVGQIFKRVLMDAGVYKSDDEGNLAFDRFMNSIECK
jgi:UDPglucose--hexose-1-phosphate uridylyltransferase